ncbi:VWA domain-containing protein [Nocardioides sp. DS6]|uniref:VWA domain-containing protein n=1 Tax=Nocardioides eburneus TaxID=3231482 RepID=A0ABV3SYD5_9ACTN
MTLLDRHLAFLHALRGAGLPVSLAEDLDAVAAISAIGWSSRETVRDAYAAALVKKQSLRPTFDAVFELYFPRLVGEGAASLGDADEAGDEGEPPPVKDGPEALDAFRGELEEALRADDTERLRALAAEAMARFGAMPGRGPGLSSWSSYTALRRVSPEELVASLVAGLRLAGWTAEEAERTVGRRVGEFSGMVEADSRRRIVEERGPQHLVNVHVTPTLDRLDFLHMRRADVDRLRREIYPLARRLAARLAREQHTRRRGPLDMRRTIRSSIASGGVPLETRHKPRRPHRTELVVLCDVSGSVANFASFTLLLVFALQEVFSKVRAFTFVDTVHEVTPYFRPGGDLADTMTRLVQASEHAALFGRTNYGRAFATFAEEYADALTPRSSLLILGDARNNYSDLRLDALRRMVDASRHAWWLNPEARRQWDTGDSEAARYGALVPMVECRNLTQLSEFVHDIA